MKGILETLFDMKGKLENQYRMIQDMRTDIVIVKKGVQRSASRQVNMDGEGEQLYKVKVPLANVAELMELEDAIKKDEATVNSLVRDEKDYSYDIFFLR